MVVKTFSSDGSVLQVVGPKYDQKQELQQEILNNSETLREGQLILKKPHQSAGAKQQPMMVKV